MGRYPSSYSSTISVYSFLLPLFNSSSLSSAHKSYYQGPVLANPFLVMYGKRMIMSQPSSATTLATQVSMMLELICLRFRDPSISKHLHFRLSASQRIFCSFTSEISIILIFFVLEKIWS